MLRASCGVLDCVLRSKAHRHDGNGLAETAPMRVFRVFPFWRRGLNRRLSVVVSKTRWNSSGLRTAQRAVAAFSLRPTRTFPSSGRSVADRMVVFGSLLARFEFFPQNLWMTGVVHGVVRPSVVSSRRSAVGSRRSAVGGAHRGTVAAPSASSGGGGVTGVRFQQPELGQ